MIRFRWAAALLCLVPVGCGGTNSETPFPLEPDFRRMDGGPPASGRYVVFGAASRDAGAPEPEPESAEPPAE